MCSPGENELILWKFYSKSTLPPPGLHSVTNLVSPSCSNYTKWTSWMNKEERRPTNMYSTEFINVMNSFHKGRLEESRISQLTRQHSQFCEIKVAAFIVACMRATMYMHNDNMLQISLYIFIIYYFEYHAYSSHVCYILSKFAFLLHCWSQHFPVATKHYIAW